MEYIIIVILCLITIAFLKVAFSVNITDIKKIKSIGYDKSLNEITNVLPENKVVCEEILKKLNHKTTKIEELKENEKTLTYYSVITNRIMIANIKGTFTRIQTIAHECLHSVQNRRLLLFNFIYSNIYLLYFFVICMLTIFRIEVMPLMQVGILLVLGLVYYSVRSYLETDAMTRAPYLAKEYMETKKVLSEEQIEEVVENYKILNAMGIPMTNFMLLTKVMIKIIIYCVIVIIV